MFSVAAATEGGLQAEQIANVGTFHAVATMLGLALGPYAAGKISGAFGANLRIGLAGVLVVVPFALASLEICRRDLINRERQVPATAP
jgi:hypothetical protein